MRVVGTVRRMLLEAQAHLVVGIPYVRIHPDTMAHAGNAHSPRPDALQASLTTTARRARRARARHYGSARRAHPDRRAADRGDGPVNQRLPHQAPPLRPPARGPAEPADPVQGSRLRRPGPGLPAVAETGQRRDLAASYIGILPCG